MSDSYEKVKESERLEAFRERARIIVAAEQQFPRSHQYHRFMHFVEAVESSGASQDTVWEGVTRRMTEIMTTKTADLANHDQLVSVESDVATMKMSVANVESEMADLKIMMARLLEQTKPRA